MISLREKETAKCIKPKKRTSLPELLKSLPIQADSFDHITKPKTTSDLISLPKGSHQSSLFIPTEGVPDPEDHIVTKKKTFPMQGNMREVLLQCLAPEVFIKPIEYQQRVSFSTAVGSSDSEFNEQVIKAVGRHKTSFEFSVVEEECVSVSPEPEVIISVPPTP